MMKASCLVNIWDYLKDSKIVKEEKMIDWMSSFVHHWSDLKVQNINVIELKSRCYNKKIESDYQLYART